MLLADRRNQPVLRARQAHEILNVAALLRAHFGDEHLMLLRKRIVHHARNAHRRVEARRSGQHAIAPGEQLL